MKRHTFIGEHLAGFLACYAAAVAASAASAAFLSYIGRPAGHSGVLHEVFTFLLTLAGFTLGASILALPAVTIAYPIAVVLARRLVTPLRTAIAGAIVGPLVGIAATMLFFGLISGPGPTSGFAQAIFLFPIASAAGAAIGWTVSTLERRKIARSKPD